MLMLRFCCQAILMCFQHPPPEKWVAVCKTLPLTWSDKKSFAQSVPADKRRRRRGRTRTSRQRRNVRGVEYLPKRLKVSSSISPNGGGFSVRNEERHQSKSSFLWSLPRVLHGGKSDKTVKYEHTQEAQRHAPPMNALNANNSWEWKKKPTPFKESSSFIPLAVTQVLQVEENEQQVMRAGRDTDRTGL